MNATYQLIPLADARSGMVLADVVRDERGNILLSQGMVLTDALLAALARHDIDAVAILAAEQDRQAPVDAEAVQARLDHLFRNNERDDHQDWATGILRRYIEDYRLQHDLEREREVQP
jgi:hypothetical protein